MMKNKISNSVVIAAIAGLVILETVALLNGINGTQLRVVLVVIAGIAGWTIPFPKIK